MWVAWHLLKPGGGVYSESSLAHFVPGDAALDSGTVRAVCGRKVPGQGEVFQYHYSDAFDRCSRCEKKAQEGG